MAILTVAELRTHVASSLPDAALQRLLDDAEADITIWAGPLGNATELFDGRTAALILGRSPSAIVSVRQDIYGTPLTLAANDYRTSGYVVRRLTNGTNQQSTFGAGTAEVVYTPAEARRKIVQVDLVKLELAFSGLMNNAIEGWAEGFGDKSIAERRTDILASLREPQMYIVGAL